MKSYLLILTLLDPNEAPGLPSQLPMPDLQTCQATLERARQSPAFQDGYCTIGFASTETTPPISPYLLQQLGEMQ